MPKAHRLLDRKQSSALAGAVPINFLLGCSETALQNFELARLAEVADLRKELILIVDRIIDESVKAAIARWFFGIDRQQLQQMIAGELDPLKWAAQMIRDGQHSEEELIPLVSLPHGAAHLAAAARYQKRNVAEGKCSKCPSPLDPNSETLCIKHLLMARERYTPKRKRVEAGTIAWLYGESLEPGDGRSLPRQNRIMRRVSPEGKALIERVAKQLGVKFTTVRAVALGDRRSERIAEAVMAEFDLLLSPTKSAQLPV